MRVATPNQVLNTLGVVSSVGTSVNAKQALDDTYGGLIAALETDLVEASWVNIFNTPAFSGNLKYPYKIRLSSGFLVEDEDVVIRTCKDGFNVFDGSQGVILDSTKYICDKTFGVISIFSGLESNDRSLGVWFDSGYKDDGTGQLQGVKSEIVSAHASLACSYIMNNSAMISKERRARQEIPIKSYNDNATRLIQYFHRPRMSVVWPVYEQVIT